ncbi:MAG: thioredoxin domain-containing protein [Elusimicrobia bacterium]|nr:thioredoxin domain-containing protein [Elusimicrobiota bacterium]
MRKKKPETLKPADVRRKPNRLVHEKSPYLLQHADNPVDWYPWGEEAFEKAKKEDKPILLSIGYSTCHWCHVMEEESFSREEIAGTMNRYLVCIKLDREERPDIDRIYMTAVSAMTGAGGWPLNVFLTPDRKPFFGGTYFPPESRRGRASWPQIVEYIGQAWRNPEERRKILESGEGMVKALEQHLSRPGASEDVGEAALRAGYESLRDSYDSEWGGFGEAPKFPTPVHLGFLFRYHDYARRKKGLEGDSRTALDMALNTLRGLARGGIRDHVGGGFHRYSTDRRWRLPHFEKMLYDNAQLAVNCLEAYQVTKDDGFVRVARETLDYVLRDMTHSEGGFYSAEDADSFPSPVADDRAVGGEEMVGGRQPKNHSFPSSFPATDAERKREGAFYVWERDEVHDVLGPEAGEIFCYHYDLFPDGNVGEDPFGEFPKKNVLYVAHPLEDTARKFGLTPESAARTLANCARLLSEARGIRPRPNLDDKILTSWNGLMISAFARAHQVMGDGQDLDAAVKAALFLQTRLYDPRARRLYHRWRDGERDIPGLADDHAFLSQGLIDLYEASFSPVWLDWAETLMETMVDRFYDAAHGGFFSTAPGHDKLLLLRARDELDNVEPSAASVAVLNLLRLARLTDRRDFADAAEKSIRALGPSLRENPRSFSNMLSALSFSLSEPVQIVLTGERTSPGYQEMLRVIHRFYLPNKVLLEVNGGPLHDVVSRRLSFLKGRPASPKGATAYVCVGYSCRRPAEDPSTLAEQLRQL